MTAVGLCGSDLHWYEDASIGETGLGAPLVLGHELAGVIEGGPRDGERVAVDPADPCEACDACLAGRGRLCAVMRFAGQAPTDGALRTRMAWPAARCVPIPASIPDHEAPLLEVLGIAIHALDLAGIEIDEGSPRSAAAPAAGLRAGVYGAGPIGLVLIRALRAAGVREIVATDRLPHRVAAAQASGATTALLAEAGAPDPAATIPVDVAFECAGTDEALDTAVRAIAPGGRVLLLGIPWHGPERVSGVHRQAQGARPAARAPDGGAGPGAGRGARRLGPRRARRAGDPPVRARGCPGRVRAPRAAGRG